MIAMVALFGASAIVIGRKARGEQARVQQFQASLARSLPPEVQADMKPRPLGLVTSVAILVVVLPIAVAGMITTGKPSEVLKAGTGLVGALGCAAWTGWIPGLAYRTWSPSWRQALPLARFRAPRLDRRRPSLRAPKETSVEAPALDSCPMDRRSGSRRLAR